MAKKEAAKKSAKKASKRVRKIAAGKPKTQAAVQGRSAPPRRKALRGQPRKGSAKKAPSGKGIPIRVVTSTVTISVGSASSAGEMYGEEGWREEELSAGELEIETPEIEELGPERDRPEIGGDAEDDSEW